MRGSQQGKAAACCPITSQQSDQFKPLPHRHTHHGIKACEAVPPLADVRRVAQQHIYGMLVDAFVIFDDQKLQFRRGMECLFWHRLKFFAVRARFVHLGRNPQ